MNINTCYNLYIQMLKTCSFAYLFKLKINIEHLTGDSVKVFLTIGSSCIRQTVFIRTLDTMENTTMHL
ncbi:hypothetical protein YWY31_32630 [Paenibacillus illinoisensis]